MSVDLGTGWPCSPDETLGAAKRMPEKILAGLYLLAGLNVLVFERGLSTPMEPHERTGIRGRKSAREFRAAPRRTAAEAASLCARMTGSVIDGEEWFRTRCSRRWRHSARRRARQSGRRGCFASRTIPRSTICAAARGRRPFVPMRTRTCSSIDTGRRPPRRRRQHAHIHAPSRGAALEHHPDGRARLFARRNRRRHWR